MVTRSEKMTAQAAAIKMAYLSSAVVAVLFITGTAVVDEIVGQAVYGNISYGILVATGALAPMFVAPIVGVIRYRVLVARLADAAAARRAEITAEGIEDLVDGFYTRVRADTVLGPIFTRTIGDGDVPWTLHLSKMKRFWRSVMLGEGSFHGRPMETHARIPNLGQTDFEHWLTLFRATVRDSFQPNPAQAIIAKAERIAHSLSLGYEFHQERLRQAS